MAWHWPCDKPLSEPMEVSVYVSLGLNEITQRPRLNSLVPGRCGCNLKLVIFKLTSRLDILSISCEIALRWMPKDFTDDKSTLVEVITWANVDPVLYLHMASLGHNELIASILPMKFSKGFPWWKNNKKNKKNMNFGLMDLLDSSQKCIHCYFVFVQEIETKLWGKFLWRS